MGNCLEETVVGPLNRPAPANGTVARRALLQLSRNASVPTNCVHGNTGPLCALCLPGYTLQSGVCAPCDPKDAFANWSSGSQAGLLIGCAIVGVIVLAFGLFQPISPGLERTAAAAIAGGHALKEALVSCATACAHCGSKAPAKDGQAASAPDASAAVEDVASSNSIAAKEKSKLSEVEALRDQAVLYVHSADAAFAVGTALMGDGGSTDDGSNAGAVDAALEFQDKLEELMEKLAKYMKIIFKCVAVGSRAKFDACLCASAEQLTVLPARAALAQLLPGAWMALCHAD